MELIGKAKEGRLKNAQNFEIAGLQQMIPAKHSSLTLHYKQVGKGGRNWKIS